MIVGHGLSRMHAMRTEAFISIWPNVFLVRKCD